MGTDEQVIETYMVGAVACPSLEIAERYARNLSAGKRIAIIKRVTTFKSIDETLSVYEGGKKLPHGE